MQRRIKDFLKNLLYISQWLPGYSRRDLKGDLFAGITVGIMLIPQGMAYAVLAGVNPIYGLYASTVPLLIYPLFGTSRHLSIGVVAVGMLIVSAGVSPLAEPGSARYLELVMLLTALTGLLQLLMYLFRLGFLDNLISKPVIVGFTTSASLIIGFSQVDHLLGISLPQTQFVYILVQQLWEQLGNVHWLTLGVGIGCIALMLLFQYGLPRLPAALIVVVVSTVAVFFMGWNRQGVEIVGSIPAGLPSLALPHFSLEDFRNLLPTVITLALVQFMNVISLGRVFANRHHYSIRPNQELLAIGLSNLAGSFFRGLPVKGSFSRTAVNEQAGARSALSNAFAAVVIMLVLLFFTSLFYYLPMPALGAIIIVAAFGMVDVDEIRYLFKTKKRDGYTALFTFLAVLFLGIETGILLGVAASLIAVLFRASRPNLAVLGHLEGSRSFRDISRNPKARELKHILVLRMDASFSFTNAEYFKDFILEKSREVDREIHAVIIDGMSINDLDTTAVEALRSLIKALEEMSIDLYFSGLKGPIRDVLRRSGLAKEIGEDRMFLSPHRAAMHILNARTEESDRKDLEQRDYR